MTTWTAARSRSRTTRSTCPTSCARTRPLPGAVSPEPLDLASAQRIVDAAALDRVVTAVERLGDGVKGKVWRVVCEGDQFAVKVFNGGYPGAVARERGFYEELGEAATGLPIPRLLAASDDGEIVPHGFAVMSVVAGDAFREHLAALGRDGVREILRQAAGALARLHEHRRDWFGDVPRDAGRAYATNREFMAARTDQSLTRYRELGGNPALASAIADHFSEHAELFERCTTAALCHGDLQGDNLLIDLRATPPRLSGILDFESAFAGDPLMDLALLFHMAPHPDDDLRDAVIDGHGGIIGDWRPAFDLYALAHEIELWNYYAAGGSKKPMREINRRMAGEVGLPLRRMAAARLRRH